ncbi:MAG: iron-containing alcohol dehydrogenase [Thermodesulfobacteriota bacterium]
MFLHSGSVPSRRYFFGEHESYHTGKKTVALGCSKVLCVYDKGVADAGLVRPIIQNMEKAGLEVVQYGSVLADPPDTMACLFASGGGFLADQSVGPALIAGLYGGEWSFDKMMGIGAQTLMMEDAFNKAAGFTDKDNRLLDFFYTEFAPATGAVFDISAEEMAGMFKY